MPQLQLLGSSDLGFQFLWQVLQMTTTTEV